MTTTTACRTCGAPILWCRTETGKRMPVDPQPHLEGNLRLVDPTGAMPTARPASRGRDGEPRYKSHFATCPDAARHRRETPPAPATDLFARHRREDPPPTTAPPPPPPPPPPANLIGAQR